MPDDAKSPLKLDEAFLESVGLGGLPIEVRRSLLAQFLRTLETRVGRELSASLDEDEMAEFEGLMDSGDEVGAQEWLTANIPTYQATTRRLLAELTEEVRADAAAIRAAAEESTGRSNDADVARLVRDWLATDTWEQSFDFLRAHQQTLATQAGLDQVHAQADGLMDQVHAEILRLTASGIGIDGIEELVTDVDAATFLCCRALGTRRLELAAAFLRVSAALWQSSPGPAMQIALDLASEKGDEARQSCAAIAASDRGLAVSVADDLEAIAAQVADTGTALPNVSVCAGILRDSD